MKRRDILLGASTIATAAIVANTQATTAQQPNSTVAPKPKPAARVGQNIQITKDLPGYYVTPAGAGKFPAVIVLMEAFGLNQWCRSICDRLAKSGFAAIAPDFYRGATYAYTDVPGAIAKLKSLNDAAVMSDVGKSLDFLAGKTEINRPVAE